jgi:hypothetical protein
MIPLKEKRIKPETQTEPLIKLGCSTFFWEISFLKTSSVWMNFLTFDTVSWFYDGSALKG